MDPRNKMTLLSSVQLNISLAWKSNFWLLAFWFLFGLVVVVLLSSQFSGRQPATVGLDLGLSAIRLYMVILIAMLTQELLCKEFERRYYLYSLSYPVSRYAMLLTKLLSIYAIALMLLVASAVVLAVLMTIVSSSYEQSRSISLGIPYLVAFFFIAFDLAIITAFSVLLAVLSKTPGFVLIGTIGIAILSRSYSSVLTMLAGERLIVDDPDQYKETLSLLSYLLPDLGRIDVREIALYNNLSFLPQDGFGVLLSLFSYLVLLVVLALWIFSKRRLN